MPELRCTVQTCKHNHDYYCALESINVGGSQAKKSKETCCDSFEERKGEGYSNAADYASATSRIDCEATCCQYNNDCICHAGKISVEGGDACQCEQTECATFTFDGKK